MSTLSTLANAAPVHIFGVSGVLGAAYHFSTLHLEPDFVLLELFGLYATVFAGLTYLFYLPTSSLLDGLQKSGVAAAGFNTALAASILIYRLFFHRLRGFKGPVAARATKFYFLMNIWKKCQGHLETQQLHEKYGDFVRIGPRELSIAAPGATHAIYSSSSPCIRAVFYRHQAREDHCSVLLSRSRAHHAMRRRAWDRAFNGTMLSSYEPKGKVLTDKLLEQLHTHAGEAIDITDWARFFAMDFMGWVGLGKSYGMIDTLKMHDSVKNLMSAMFILGVVGQVPWLITLMLQIPGAGATLRDFQAWCRTQVDEKIRTFNPSAKSTDIATTLLQDDRCGLGKLADEGRNDDGRLMIIAGSDTTASALAGFFYYLAANPRVQRKLQHILSEAFPAGDSAYTTAAAGEIPYVDAVINETLRLQPPVTLSLTRTTPKAGMTINGVYIPGDVTVSVPTYAVHRDGRYFERPEEFIPERWTDQPELVKDPKAFIPFSIGPYGCAGKPMAVMEMRMVLCRVVMNFDTAFADGEDTLNYCNNQKDYYTMQLQPLKMVFTPRS